MALAELFHRSDVVERSSNDTGSEFQRIRPDTAKAGVSRLICGSRNKQITVGSGAKTCATRPGTRLAN